MPHGYGNICPMWIMAMAMYVQWLCSYIPYGYGCICPTVCCKIVGNKIFKYPISGSEKYQNEFPTPKYVGIDTLIIIME